MDEVAELALPFEHAVPCSHFNMAGPTAVPTTQCVRMHSCSSMTCPLVTCRPSPAAGASPSMAALPARFLLDCASHARWAAKSSGLGCGRSLSSCGGASLCV